MDLTRTQTVPAVKHGDMLEHADVGAGETKFTDDTMTYLTAKTMSDPFPSSYHLNISNKL